MLPQVHRNTYYSFQQILPVDFFHQQKGAIRQCRCDLPDWTAAPDRTLAEAACAHPAPKWFAPTPRGLALSAAPRLGWAKVPFSKHRAGDWEATPGGQLRLYFLGKP